MNKRISGAMALTAFLSAIVGGVLMQDGTETYYCEDTDMICVGERLSSTGLTCYWTDENGDARLKRCTSTWEIYDNTEIPNKCDDYTRVRCPDGREYYLGELEKPLNGR